MSAPDNPCNNTSNNGKTAPTEDIIVLPHTPCGDANGVDTLLWALHGKTKHRSRRIDTVAVNVPGPTMAQHVLGCELLKVYPVIPLAGQVPVAVGVLSYNDDLSFGITGDYDSAPELSILADGIRESLEALAAAPARA